MTTTRENPALAEIGRNAFAAIREMVAALECDYERLEELDGMAAGSAWNGTAEESEERHALREAAGECKDREDAERRIQEDPLSLEFRTAWTTADNWKAENMTPGEYCLLLTTGGPAVRIIGEIDGDTAETARLEVQDWGTPWTEHMLDSSEDDELLLTYAQQFYMGAG